MTSTLSQVAVQSASQSTSTGTVFVGGLDGSLTAADITREFEKFGNILDVWMARNPPGFCFVEFDSESSANEAVAEMEGKYLLKKRLRVERTKHNRKGRMLAEQAKNSNAHISGNNSIALTLQVSGLSSRVDAIDLRDYVETVVVPKSVELINGNEALVHCKCIGDVELVVQSLDHTLLEGRYLRFRCESQPDHQTQSKNQEIGRDRVRSGDRFCFVATKA